MDKMPQDQPNDNKKTHIENKDTLTTRQGQPVTNNQDLRTVGNRGPAALENYDYIEKISHFDRERIPERSEEHTSELQSRGHLVCRLLLEKKNKKHKTT